MAYDLYDMYFLLEGMVKLTRSTSRSAGFFCRSQVTGQRSLFY